jgi:hypothetical protein
MDGFVQQRGVEVWPDTLDVVNLYIAMMTQRRETGGFDYSALPTVLDIIGFDSDRRQLFEDFRTMEDELLTILAENREKALAEAKANRR